MNSFIIALINKQLELKIIMKQRKYSSPEKKEILRQRSRDNRKKAKETKNVAQAQLIDLEDENQNLRKQYWLLETEIEYLSMILGGSGASVSSQPTQSRSRDNIDTSREVGRNSVTREIRNLRGNQRDPRNSVDLVNANVSKNRISNIPNTQDSPTQDDSLYPFNQDYKFHDSGQYRNDRGVYQESRQFGVDTVQYNDSRQFIGENALFNSHIPSKGLSNLDLRSKFDISDAEDSGIEKIQDSFDQSQEFPFDGVYSSFKFDQTAEQSNIGSFQQQPQDVNEDSVSFESWLTRQQFKDNFSKFPDFTLSRASTNDTFVSSKQRPLNFLEALEQNK